MKRIRANKIENIEDAQYGDLLFFTPTTSFFSHLIQKIDGSRFSHVALFLGKKYAHNLFIESQDGVGITISLLKEWRNYEIYRPELQCMPPSMILNDLGKPYDRKKIVQILSHKIFGTPLTADDDHALICSESVNKWYYYKLYEKGKATPATIYHNLKIL